jgi:large subunit ribosomal protein L31
MKKGIHPKYYEVKVTCVGCNTSFTTGSTIPEITSNVCSSCHPFYTGKQKLVDAEGRVDRFNKKYSKFNAAAPAATETK